MVVQKSSVGGMPDLQVGGHSKHQQHHGNDGHGDGGNAT